MNVRVGQRVSATFDDVERSGVVEELHSDNTAWVAWDPPHHCEDCAGSLVNRNALRPALGADGGRC